MTVPVTATGAVIAFLGGKRATFFAGLALVCILGLAWARFTLSHERSAGATCATNVANFEQTQAGNLTVIEDLRHRLAIQTAAREIERQASTAAVIAADATATEADRKADALTAQLGELYAKDPHARAWADTGVDAAVAARLPK